jgi:beta-phosphoglucomutase-like phosphatase (HAD superfamily)
LLAGVTAGVAAGIPVIALATTQAPSVLADVGASIVVNDYYDVLHLIEESAALAEAA